MGNASAVCGNHCGYYRESHAYGCCNASCLGDQRINWLTPISPKQGDVGMLSGFANGTIWLIAIAMFLSRAVIKTGLGKRIALYFVGRFGKK